jgi:hypothetical protein
MVETKIAGNKILYLECPVFSLFLKENVLKEQRGIKGTA